MEEGLLSLVEMLQENYYLQEMVLGPALRVPTPALGLLEPPWGGPGPSQPPAFCNQPGGPSPAEVTSQRRAACQRRGGGGLCSLWPKETLRKQFCLDLISPSAELL